MEAAIAEFQNRNLNADELAMLEKDWQQLQQHHQQRNEKKIAFENKVKSYGGKIADDLNPLAPNTTDRSIRMICIGTGLLILYSFFDQYRLLFFILKDPSFQDIFVLISFLPLVIVPIGIWKFWNKKRGGWTILTVWLCFITIRLIYSYLQELKYAGSPGLIELVYPERGIFPYLIPFLIYGGLLVYINMPIIKNVFLIKKDFQFYALLIPITLSLIFFVMVGV